MDSDRLSVLLAYDVDTEPCKMILRIFLQICGYKKTTVGKLHSTLTLCLSTSELAILKTMQLFHVCVCVCVCDCHYLRINLRQPKGEGRVDPRARRGVRVCDGCVLEKIALCKFLTRKIGLRERWRLWTSPTPVPLRFYIFLNLKIFTYL